MVDRRKRPDDAGERAVWEWLDALSPVQFLEVMGWGHSYHCDIGTASKALHKRGFVPEHGADRAIEVLIAVPEHERTPRWAKPIIVEDD